MPKPIHSGQRYLPGLDGLRALAVLAVIAYHLHLGWAPGGMLGVGVFFTLSGYLITDLLLGQHEATGRLRLADCWRRRARRLLPALSVLLVVIAAWVTLLDRPQLSAVRGTVLAAAGNVTNWWLIAQHSSYFAQFGPPSPLGHLWSLAVEDQFYLIWPWLLWLGLRWARGRPGTRTKLAAATLLLASLSAIEMAVLYRPGYDPTRIYDGSDTRAFALLIGAALAFAWPSRHLRAGITSGARRILDGAGVTGLAVGDRDLDRGLARRGLRRVAWWLVLVPLHWLLLSLAAWRALYQLVRAPQRWEKTEHGLARNSRRAKLNGRAALGALYREVSGDREFRREAAE